MEFEATKFGRLHGLLEAFGDLADEIIEQYRAGRENLDIINWALRYQQDMDSVFTCLVQINMNDARIDPDLTGVGSCGLFQFCRLNGNPARVLPCRIGLPGKD